MDEKNQLFINIKSMTVIKVILIFVLFYFLYLVKDILAVLFISLILASAFDPWVDWMHHKKIPRGVGVLLVYLAVFGVFAMSIYLIIPPIVNEITDLSNNMPFAGEFKAYIGEKAAILVSVFKDLSAANMIAYIKDNFATIGSVQDATSGVFSTISGFVGGIFTFLLTLVITFYMVVEENAIKKIVWSLAPQKYQVYTMHLINRMQKKIGLWLRGQLILSVIIFIFVYAGLSVLGVKYALVLALIAGLTESVPYLGPIFAAIPAVFLAFAQGGIVLAISVAIFYYIIQLTENNIIVPKLMQKVVGLNPIISISVLMIGFSVAGIIGAILSIPVATAVSVFIGDLFDHKMTSDK
ncbi:AI-2E family transporter [Candidatus Parcubacteria bacterium]|nr:AI-2E family transporter [Patescibacteria group bacterium]MBU4309300.1 AI-2E family transporter [Patescibacteria group bacterium]MBU4432277.1 AI-2E family transporter [Patescibacteria group bacterium]MBU4577661.1 AI-2E family transporter [Patescibacteria group bacterium]MCG2697347.1 AI-2E family transporter [Candidatus Parcubacteria bacterium]